MSRDIRRLEDRSRSLLSASGVTQKISSVSEVISGTLHLSIRQKRTVGFERLCGSSGWEVDDGKSPLDEVLRLYRYH